MDVAEGVTVGSGAAIGPSVGDVCWEQAETATTIVRATPKAVVTRFPLSSCRAERGCPRRVIDVLRLLVERTPVQVWKATRRATSRASRVNVAEPIQGNDA
jgi:hypothetical protein